MEAMDEHERFQQGNIPRELILAIIAIENTNIKKEHENGS